MSLVSDFGCAKFQSCKAGLRPGNKSGASLLALAVTCWIRKDEKGEKSASSLQKGASQPSAFSTSFATVSHPRQKYRGPLKQCDTVAKSYEATFMAQLSLSKNPGQDELSKTRCEMKCVLYAL